MIALNRAVVGYGSAAPSSLGLVTANAGGIEKGTTQVAPGALQVSSFTGSAAGGAPGAQFGPPGVGGAPVTIAGFSFSPVLGVVLLAGAAFVAWRILR